VAANNDTEALRREVDAWNDAAGQSWLFQVEDRGTLLVGDTRAVATRRVHRLDGAARHLMLFCDQVQPRHAIMQALTDAGFPVTDAELTRILGDLINDRLLVEDKGRYLSLPVRAGRRYLPPAPLMSVVVAEGRARRR
jgi:hypothetical protein